MLHRPFSEIALSAILAILLSGRFQGAQVQQGPESKAENRGIICKAMEAFDDGRLQVRAIIFHQRDRADAPRLGAFLLAHSGEETDLETSNGQRYRVIVFRVRSAFGRGLMLVPTGKVKLDARGEFTLFLPAQR